jgi:hypothetical protein
MLPSPAKRLCFHRQLCLPDLQSGLGDGSHDNLAVGQPPRTAEMVTDTMPGAAAPGFLVTHEKPRSATTAYGTPTEDRHAKPAQAHSGLDLGQATIKQHLLAAAPPSQGRPCRMPSPCLPVDGQGRTATTTPPRLCPTTPRGVGVVVESAGVGAGARGSFGGRLGSAQRTAWGERGLGRGARAEAS